MILILVIMHGNSSLGLKRGRQQTETVSSASADQSHPADATEDDVDTEWSLESGPNFDERLGLHRRDTLDTSFSITLNNSYTNASFAAELCSLLTNKNATQLFVRGAPDAYYAIPSCLYDAAPGLIAFAASRVVITDFSIFPKTVRALSLRASLFTAASASLAPTESATPVNGTSGPADNYLDGYDPNGNVSWEEIWNALPLLAVVNWSNGNLRGSLPNTLPAQASYFYLTNHGLSGTIPSNMFSGFSSLSYNLSIVFKVDSNQLSGTMPQDLFSGLESTALKNLQVDFSSNALTGSVPASLLQPLENLDVYSLKMSLKSNMLNGSIPETLFPSGLLRTYGLLNFDISNNSISGSIPANLFDNLQHVNIFKFNASGNSLTGNLPSPLFPSGYSPDYSPVFMFSAADNQLSGQLPSGFLSSTFEKNNTFYRFVLDLSSNSIQGTIPEQLFYSFVQPKNGGMKYDSKPASSIEVVDTTDNNYGAYDDVVLMAVSASYEFTVRLDNNQLTGPIPAGLLAHSAGPGLGASLTLNVTNNTLTGSVPEGLLQALPTKLGRMQLLASRNKLSGSPPSTCWSTTPFSIDLSYNQLSGTFPSAWQNCFMPYVSVAANQYLVGSIPAGFLNNTKIAYFNASYTSMVGKFPSKVGSSLSVLDLTYSYVDFCTAVSPSTPSPLDGFTGTCELLRTDACRCATTYSPCDISCLGCSLATRPSAEFYCVNNTWTAASVTSPVLTIPAGTGTVIVKGNVTSSSIVFSNLGSTITIDGCAYNLSSIHIEFDPAQLEKLGKPQLQQLLTFSNASSNCTSKLNGITITSGVKNGGCKVVKVSKATGSGQAGLSALFTLDSSKCNQWWIITVSVVAAVVAIGVAAIIVGIVLYRRSEAKKRSHSLHQAHL